MKAVLRAFSWYNNEFLVLIKTKVVGNLVNQSVVKVKKILNLQMQ
jgi:hypothetical protein